MPMLFESPDDLYERAADMVLTSETERFQQHLLLRGIPAPIASAASLVMEDGEVALSILPDLQEDWDLFEYGDEETPPLAQWRTWRTYNRLRVRDRISANLWSLYAAEYLNVSP